jgi:hypothetical protein
METLVVYGELEEATAFRGFVSSNMPPPPRASNKVYVPRVRKGVPGHFLLLLLPTGSFRSPNSPYSIVVESRERRTRSPATIEIFTCFAPALYTQNKHTHSDPIYNAIPRNFSQAHNMPCFRGIDIRLLDDARGESLPEFPHPEGASVRLQVLEKLQSAPSATIPVLGDSFSSLEIDAANFLKFKPLASVYVASLDGAFRP